MKYNLFVKGMVLLSSTILIADSCKKDSPPQEQLPPETHTGAYTFGCKVDGVVYKASGKDGLLAKQHVYYSYYSSDSTFNIGAGSIINQKFSININFKCSVLNSQCLLSNFPYKATFTDDSNGTVPGNSNTYSTNNFQTGNVVVKYFNGTFAPGNFGTIASGIFEMECINANGKIIKITEGRFDSGL